MDHPLYKTVLCFKCVTQAILSPLILSTKTGIITGIIYNWFNSHRVDGPLTTQPIVPLTTQLIVPFERLFRIKKMVTIIKRPISDKFW